LVPGPHPSKPAKNENPPSVGDDWKSYQVPAGATCVARPGSAMSIRSQPVRSPVSKLPLMKSQAGGKPVAGLKQVAPQTAEPGRTVAVHWPSAPHASAVQALPSSHSASLGTWLQPKSGSQASAVHGPPSSHAAALGVWLQPFAGWQASTVQATPSSQDWTPVPGWHAPAPQ
jgi:hypothetical protein